MNSIIEQKFRYDHKCFPNNFCDLEINLKKFEKPIFIFLEMTHFFQAHKNFVEGFSRFQLVGNHIDLKKARKECRNAFFYQDFDVDRKRFKDFDVANPCGLLAKFFPGDIYLSLEEIGGQEEENRENLDYFQEEKKEQIFHNFREEETLNNFFNKEKDFVTNNKENGFVRKNQKKIKKKENQKKNVKSPFPKTNKKYRIKQTDIADPYFSKVFQPSKEEDQWVNVKSGRFINWMVF